MKSLRARQILYLSFFQEWSWWDVCVNMWAILVFGSIKQYDLQKKIQKIFLCSHGYVNMVIVIAVCFIQRDMLNSIAKEWAMATWNNMDSSSSHIIVQNKPDTKEYIFYNSIYVKLKNRQNLSMMTEIRIEVTLVLRHGRPWGLIFKMLVDTLFLNPDVTQNLKISLVV